VDAHATGRQIPRTTSALTFADHLDHWLGRWGFRREEHRVEPGIYALGSPGPESPVFVSANYTLSFDTLRSALPEIDGYILVLDTHGINVWCAAGKGTFGTDELVQRIEETGLADVVSHRALILPQLGAVGVAAHEVRRRTGFAVEYGPVRAQDLLAYLTDRQATPEMRTVTFGFAERLVLLPVDFVRVLLPMIGAAVLLYFAGGLETASAVVVAVLGGVVFFPLLLPWLPTPNFTTKGLVLGFVCAIPFAAARLAGGTSTVGWTRIAWAVSYLLAMPAVTAFLALNFTGSTPFASRSGVKSEIAMYTRPLAWLFGSGLVLGIVLAVL